ncbi:MAG: asparagine--tRNA ligase, partial [Bacteroidetes bacterium]|nr:asparagine--tRNA ligase [Bacteroidota bacterium]
MKNVNISQLANCIDQEIQLQGWVQNKRDGKGIAFIILRDGSGFCQCIVSQEDIGDVEFEKTKLLSLETSVRLTGKVVADERQLGGVEVHATALEIVGTSEDYPISKKAHGVDFLLDKRHLWLRSRKQWAIMRVRNEVIFGIHSFFQQEGYVQMDAPIFTGNACEGTTDLFETEFFDKPAYLSQSGQLYGEAMAMAMGKIYTFGPTFRAEKSKTRRHLSEFWMIEPEMAFYNLEMTMDVIEKFIQYVVNRVLENCKTELEVLERDTTTLQNVAKPFVRLSYNDAVKILKGEKEVNGKQSIKMLEEDLASKENRLKEIATEASEKEGILAKGGLKKGKIAYYERSIQQLREEQKQLEEDCRNIPNWISSALNFEYGSDLGGSDETVITRLFDTPVMVYDWPKVIKAFYMKESESDSTLVKGVDVLAPEGYGEIVGGGERET